MFDGAPKRHNDGWHLNALEIIARVCATGVIPQFKQLTSKLLSYWKSPEIPEEMGYIFRDVIKRVKALDSTSLPEIYLNAMRISYQRYVSNLSSMRGENREEQAEEAIKPFLSLSSKIAQSQASLNAPVSTLAYIAEKGALWALQGGLENLEFLQGSSFFVVRVKGEDAASILVKLEEAGKGANAPDYDSDDDDLGDWVLYHEYCEVLKSQAEKYKNEGGLKKGKNRGNQARRISFTLGKDFDLTELQEQPVSKRRSRRLSDQQKSPNYEEKYSDDEDYTTRLEADALPTEEALP